MNRFNANLVYHSKIYFSFFGAYFIIKFSIHLHNFIEKNILLQIYILIYMINSYDVLYDVTTV